MELTENKLATSIAELKSYGDKKLAKYRRNYRRYSYTPYATLEDIKNPSEIGFFQGNAETGGEEDTTPTPEINVIKSTIDTLTSKIAQSKVRPFFNCVNGSFKDILIVKQAQQFFDQYFDWQNVNKSVSLAFRDSCIFDTGVIFVDSDTNRIRKALPWQVFVRPAEMTYGKITKAYYEQRNYPVTLLPSFILEEVWDKLQNVEFVNYGVYFDVFRHKKAYVINDIRYTKIMDYEAPCVPFVFLHYNSPIHGDSSESVVDMLNSIQLEIDSLMAKINDASQLTPANTMFLPEGSTIKAQQLNNRVGNIVQYKPTPNMTSSPVTVATPSFIDPQYMDTVERLKQTAYEMVGISQLSAMSSKPTGLDSGIALQSMENIESDRFETQLNQVVRSYVDLAKVCISVFPADEDILPENKLRRSVQWRDIVEESKNMSIQFSGADALSKDPSEKLKQLQMLAQAGVVPASRIAQFMEIPDLQSGYSLSNNAINAVMTIIERVINDNDDTLPEYIPFGMLKEEIINTQLSLTAANYELNKEDIDKLDRFYEKVEEKEEKWQEDINTLQQGAVTEDGLPVQQNVLTQEANMTQVQTPEVVNSNLDVMADGAQPGDWNAGK